MADIYTVSMLISIALFTLSTHITPGPTNIVLLSSVLNFGYKKTIPFMIGNIISYPIMMLFTGLGVGMFLVEHPTLMSFIKVAGVVYLCWMAYKIATDNSTYEQNDEDNKNNKPFTFWQAMFYPLTNPKAWILYTSIISLYVTSSTHSMSQISVIVFFTLIAMIITVYTWAFGAIALKKLIKNEKFLKRLNQAMAFLLVLSIMPILF